MTLTTGAILQNRYRIVKLVAQGGFGAVYRGWDLVLEQPVAVKESFGSGPDSQRQFEREAKLLAGLRHSNLPRVGDHFIVPGQGQYLVMDFVEGHSLADLLGARGGPLSEAEALPWIRQVCDALTYLHGRTPPIIHRDIKPENIIITGEGRAILVDFGISKVYDPSKGTTVGAKAVTPGYSPPEQYGRGRTDARSDVYSLGATLYTLLTGQTPPEAPDLSSGADVLTPPRAVNPAVSEETSQVILAAMALSMSQRLGDAAGFGQMLAARAAPVAPPPVALPAIPANAPATGRKRGAAVLGWLVGVAALVALAVWVATALSGRNGGSETATQPTAAATEAIAQATGGAATHPTGAATIAASATPAAPAGQVVVVAANGGRWETAEESGELTANTTIPLPSGQRVTLISDGGVAHVALPDGSELFLHAGAEIGLTASATGTTIELERGRAVVRGVGAPITVGSIVDAQATLLGAGLMGLYLEPSSLLFEAACLVGDCEVAGAGDGAPLRLPAGQAAVVGSANTAGLPEEADSAAYATPAAAPAATPAATPTLITAAGDRQLSEPCGLAVDADGNVYVADTGNDRILKFDADGTLLGGWGSKGSEPGQFNSPEGIAVDSQRNVYVADAGNNRIQRFTAEGVFLDTWDSGQSRFTYPKGVTVDADGNTYVADTYNHRIQKFAADQTFLDAWGSQGKELGQFRNPHGLAVDANGDVYVAETINRRIQKFAADGRFLDALSNQSDEENLFYSPWGIALDAAGNIYVADSGDHRILKLNADGTLLGEWGSYGRGQGQFNSPRGIAIDANGNVYVTDAYNDRIQKFNGDGEFLAMWGGRG